MSTARPYEGLLPGDAIDVVQKIARGEHGMPKRLRPVCGARTRSGKPCQGKPVWDEVNDRPRNGRCRLHGGLSTGPKSADGRRKVGDAARERHRKSRLPRPPRVAHHVARDAAHFVPDALESERAGLAVR